MSESAVSPAGGDAGRPDGASASRSRLVTPTTGPASIPGAPADWDEPAYLAANPDVARAVQRGSFASGYDHYQRFGRQEGRHATLVPEFRTRAAADFVIAEARRTAGRPTATLVTEELVAAMRAAGSARFGEPGFSPPSLLEPLVIQLDGAAPALREALGVLGILVTGEAGPGTRLIVDEGDLERHVSAAIQFHGWPRGLIALGRGAAVQGPVRFEGPDQVFILGDTMQSDRTSGPIALRGARAGVAIGRGSSANGVVMLVNGDGTSITVGDDVMMAHGIEIAASDSHGIFDLADRRLLNPPASIEIGPHVWLGAHCRVLKGTRVGAGSVVALGAAVTRDVPSASMVAGVPARILRRGVSWSRHLVPSEGAMNAVVALLGEVTAATEARPAVGSPGSEDLAPVSCAPQPDA